MGKQIRGQYWLLGVLLEKTRRLIMFRTVTLVSFFALAATAIGLSTQAASARSNFSLAEECLTANPTAPQGGEAARRYQQCMGTGG
jgi:hypothetical protein